MKEKARKNEPLDFAPISHCLLLPPLNQSLQNKGLSTDVIEKEGIETGKPAIRFLTTQNFLGSRLFCSPNSSTLYSMSSNNSLDISPYCLLGSSSSAASLAAASSTALLATASPAAFLAAASTACLAAATSPSDPCAAASPAQVVEAASTGCWAKASSAAFCAVASSAAFFAAASTTCLSICSKKFSEKIS